MKMHVLGLIFCGFTSAAQGAVPDKVYFEHGLKNLTCNTASRFVLELAWSIDSKVLSMDCGDSTLKVLTTGSTKRNARNFRFPAEGSGFLRESPRDELIVLGNSFSQQVLSNPSAVEFHSGRSVGVDEQNGTYRRFRLYYLLVF